MRLKEFELDAMRLEFLPRIELLPADRVDVAAGAGHLAEGEHSVFRFQRRVDRNAG